MKLQKRNEKGQAIVLVAISFVIILGFAGIAIDGGLAYSERRAAQNAADTAVMAAILAKSRNENIVTAATRMTSANGYEAGANNTVVTINNPPGNDCSGIVSRYAGDSQYIQVMIDYARPSLFMSVLGYSQLTGCVEAVGKWNPPIAGELFAGFSVVGLAPSGCDAVYISGNGQLQTWGGGVFSNSSDTCGLHFQGSSQTQTHEGSGGYNMVAGSYQTTGNPGIQDHGEGFHFNQQQIPYPPSDLPNPTCSGNAVKSGSSMNPGSWTGEFPPKGVSTLSSGIYCISGGDFKLNAKDKLSGTGVVIVLVDGSIDWNGSSEIKLSAPTSGEYKGLLIYAPLSNSSLMKINGNSNSELVGTILTPAADIRINGNNSQLQKTDSKIIGYRVEISGSADVQIVMTSKSQFEVAKGATVELTK